MAGVIYDLLGSGGSSGGGGGYPSVITKASLASNFTVVATFADAPGAGMSEVTGLSCPITTTRTNEIVHLEYTSELVENATPGALALGYQIDSNTPVSLLYYSASASRTTPNTISAFVEVTGAPGEYEIKIAASKVSGNTVLARRVAEGTATDLIEMKVTQFA